MPELPEVEATRRLLARWIGRATITRAQAHDARRVLAGSPAAFARALAGRAVTRVGRRGKWLRIELAGGASLYSHLGLTGRWVKRAATEEALPWERVRLDVKKGRRTTSVRYVDPRRFGRLVVARAEPREWKQLGPDPLADGIDVAALAETLARRKLSVKEVLMDQTVLAGVGNIQATEALWRAKIDPRSKAARVTKNDVRTIARAILWTIRRTLADLAKDGEALAYVQDAGGKNPFLVYGRKGEKCPRCRTTIVRVVLGGRGTTLCPRCQVRRA